MANNVSDEDFNGERQPASGLRRPGTLLTIALMAIVLLGWPGFAGFYSDWLWFQEVGYQRIFSTILLTKMLLALCAVVLSALFIWINLKIALRVSQAGSKLVRYITVNKERLEIPDIAGFIERWVLPLSLLGGLLLGLQYWDSWEVVLQYRHQTPFGDSDPVFGRDIAYYFFSLPLFDLISESLMQLVIVTLVGSLIINLMRAATLFSRRGGSLGFNPAARRHLLFLGAGLFMVIAWRARLEMMDLLFSNNGTVDGANYTDINATLPVLKIQVFIALLIAVIAIASMFISANIPLWVGLGIYLLVLVGGGWLYPSMVQRFSVAPNELVKETPYIKNNIDATRKAYGLALIEERELSGDVSITLKDIQENSGTINNIRLWDHKPILETFGQLQEIRTYYDFQSADNDRYMIDGEMRQIIISPRELSIASLPNRNWINERLTFTHGFGLTLSPANQVTAEGLPKLYIKDIPPVSSIPSLNVKVPEIYYGELTHEPVYVKTTAEEFNYPSGENNVYSNYTGEGGVSIGSYWRKLLFATRFGDMKLILSDDMTADSRVLFYRNIRERLSRIAPFLHYDQDPYMVISDGRLFWIEDAYTVSDRYPYSQSVGGINYIRNSVKAVIDAYNGKVDFYIADPADPVIRTWAAIFPGTFKQLSEMPADLRTHLRYPEDIFSIQTSVYSTYHMDKPQTLYNKEDQWEIASATEAEGKMLPMSPYYTIMKLPGEKKEEFILMLPFTPRSKDNLAAWMVARADGENYGKLAVYQFPKQRLIYGPKQIVARINQDAEISRQLTLWNQRGSQVIFGTLLVIPVKESLIYVQPLYLKADTGKIPELKRVIVTAENRIAMEETLEAGLSRIFGGATTAQPQTTTAAQTQPGSAPAVVTDVRSLSIQASELYKNAIQAQRDGDWARYGEEIKKLGAVLEKMQKEK
jgi:uncharacterized membrane protein (UPF0182 family)